MCASPEVLPEAIQKLPKQELGSHRLAAFVMSDSITGILCMVFAQENKPYVVVRYAPT